MDKMDGVVREMVTETGTEICVFCRKDTGIPSDLPIDHHWRKDSYVENSGQLHPECFLKVYGPAWVFVE